MLLLGCLLKGMSMINVSSGIDTRSIGRHDANFSQSSGAEKMAEAEIRELFSLHSVGMPVDHAKSCSP